MQTATVLLHTNTCQCQQHEMGFIDWFLFGWFCIFVLTIIYGIRRILYHDDPFGDRERILRESEALERDRDDVERLFSNKNKKEE